MRNAASTCGGRQWRVPDLADRRAAAVEVEHVRVPAPLLGRHARDEAVRTTRAFEHGHAGLQLVAEHRGHMHRTAFETRMDGALPLLAHEQRDAERQRRARAQRNDAGRERLA